MGIRNIEVTKDGKKMVSSCMDHSIRIWDFETCKAQNILAGHTDVVTGATFLNSNTLISSSWDMRIKVWKV